MLCIFSCHYLLSTGLSAFAEKKKALAAALFANANRGHPFGPASAASAAGGGGGEQSGHAKGESVPMSGEKAEGKILL